MQRIYDKEISWFEAQSYPIGTLFINSDYSSPEYQYLIIKTTKDKFYWLALDRINEENKSTFSCRKEETYLLIDNEKILQYVLNCENSLNIRRTLGM